METLLQIIGIFAAWVLGCWFIYIAAKAFGIGNDREKPKQKEYDNDLWEK